MNAQPQSELARLESRMDQMRANGLSDFKFYPGAVSEVSPEDFAREANLMLNAVENDEFEDFSFGDSPQMK